ncbi:MAG: hypothetical protein HRT81_17730 [Henriciella sp.]|nr:hypothetical protein [Henriciella sp.]
MALDRLIITSLDGSRPEDDFSKSHWIDLSSWLETSRLEPPLKLIDQIRKRSDATEQEISASTDLAVRWLGPVAGGSTAARIMIWLRTFPLVSSALRAARVRPGTLGVGLVGAIALLANFTAIASWLEPNNSEVLDAVNQLEARFLELAKPAEADFLPDSALLNEEGVDEAARRIALANPDLYTQIDSEDPAAIFDTVASLAVQGEQQVAETWRDLGSLTYYSYPDRALEAFRKASSIDSRNYDTWMALIVLEQEQAGNLPSAIAAADSAVRTARTQAEKLRALQWIAELEMITGQTERAYNRYLNIVPLTEALLEIDPSNDNLNSDLADAYIGKAEAAFELGDLSGARRASLNAIELEARRLTERPSDFSAMAGLSSALMGLGELEMAEQDFTAAEIHFKRSLNLDDRIAEQDPDDIDYQRDIGTALEKYGGVLVQQEREEDALAALDRSLSISRKIYAEHSERALAQSDLAEALFHLGEAELVFGRSESAEAKFSEASIYLRQLRRDQPQDADWSRSLLLNQIRLAMASGKPEPCADAETIMTDLQHQSNLSDDDEILALLQYCTEQTASSR